MDTDTIDRRFDDLHRQGQQTSSLIQAMASKLAAASETDPNAREWALDLREIALAVRDEQSATTDLLQSIHALVDDHVRESSASQVQQAAPVEPMTYAPPPPQPQYAAAYQAPPQYQQYQPAQGGGVLQRFLGGRFGQAIVSGAGFGIGDDIVNEVFDRF